MQKFSISVSQFVLPYIKNEGVRGAAIAYFKIGSASFLIFILENLIHYWIYLIEGDFIVDTTADFFKKKSIEYDDKNKNNNDNNKRLDR